MSQKKIIQLKIVNLFNYIKQINDFGESFFLKEGRQDFIQTANKCYNEKLSSLWYQEGQTPSKNDYV